MYTDNLDWEILRELDTSTVTTSYVALGTPLLHPSYILKIVNMGTEDLYVSKDGINAIDVVPSDGGFFLYDESKSTPNVYKPAVPQGTQFSVKSVSGDAGEGNVYLVSQFIVVN